MHGEAAAVVLSAEDFRRLKDPRASRDFKDGLLIGPSLEGVDLETFDLSAFVATGKTKDKNAVAVLAPEVMNFVKESEELFKLGEKFDKILQEVPKETTTGFASYIK